MKDKYYAVSRGIETGIYSSWEECKKQTHGISNAKFRSFYSLKAAQKYLNKREAFNQNYFNRNAQSQSQETYQLYFYVKLNGEDNFTSKFVLKHKSGICVCKFDRNFKCSDRKIIELQTLFFALKNATDLDINRIEIFSCSSELVNRLKNVQKKYFEKNTENLFVTVKDKLAYFSSWEVSYIEDSVIDEELL
ncbi:unnamed protein product [Blepharisma stoltei]|uniref:Ribonuclease H n=1 Tax=Blepharisma stoltei TaxID=1481888 RepID=A0AAU9IJ78_9CILI|nr:unnamed protein product [Blepharisma stoltei]